MYESLLNYPNSLFGQFERLRRELDDAFGVSGLPSSIRSVAAGGLPAVNVGRTSNSVEVYAFAPGLDASKIDVTIDRGVLRISGERAASLPEGRDDVNVYAHVDPAQVKASYRDGVLLISVARRESAQPKRISVQ
jgi:HSP20 family protein